MSTTIVKSVMARNNWPDIFKRSRYEWSKDKNGKPVRGELIERLEFPPGQPIGLTAEQYEDIKADIGTALVEVEYDENNRPRVVAPTEAVDPNTVAELQQTIAELQEAVELLVAQVRELGEEPCVDVEGEADPAE